MGFSRQEYWSGLPFPSPGDVPDPGIEPRSPTLQANALTSAPPGKSYRVTQIALVFNTLTSAGETSLSHHLTFVWTIKYSGRCQGRLNSLARPESQQDGCTFRSFGYEGMRVPFQASCVKGRSRAWPRCVRQTTHQGGAKSQPVPHLLNFTEDAAGLPSGPLICAVLCSPA